jgi:hypothetical protein
MDHHVLVFFVLALWKVHGNIMSSHETSQVYLIKFSYCNEHVTQGFQTLHLLVVRRIAVPPVPQTSLTSLACLQKLVELSPCQYVGVISKPSHKGGALRTKESRWRHAGSETSVCNGIKRAWSRVAAPLGPHRSCLTLSNAGNRRRPGWMKCSRPPRSPITPAPMQMHGAPAEPTDAKGWVQRPQV